MARDDGRALPTDTEQGMTSAGADQTRTVASLGERLDALEAIVRSLEEDPAMSLDEALRLYEQARRLSQSCHGDLARAQLRLTEIDATMADP